MATSATQLSLIIKTLCTEFELNEKQVLEQLSKQDLLPAKLNKPDVKKNFSIFASKHAKNLPQYLILYLMVTVLGRMANLP